MSYQPSSLLLPVNPEEISAPTGSPASPRASRLLPRLRDAGAILVVLALVAIGCALPFCG